MKTVILHHAECPDGFGAAWWLRYCLLQGSDDADIELVAMNWHERPPLERCEGAVVFSVDYCPDAQWIEAIGEVCHSQTIFDHHQSSGREVEAVQSSHGRPVSVFTRIHDFAEVDELQALSRTAIVLDQDHSGVGIVAAWCERKFGIKCPEFLLDIEDRDLWRWSRPNTRDTFASVTARPYTIEAWDDLHYAEYADLVAEGKGINLYRDRLIEQVAASTFKITLGGDGEGWYFDCASAPYSIGSDVAGLLAQRVADAGPTAPMQAGAYCILHDSHVQIGLRSVNGDVAKVAEFHGGGGHEHASGLRLTWDEFRKRVWDNFPVD